MSSTNADRLDLARAKLHKMYDAEAKQKESRKIVALDANPSTSRTISVVHKKPSSPSSSSPSARPTSVKVQPAVTKTIKKTTQQPTSSKDRIMKKMGMLKKSRPGNSSHIRVK
eukprot:TRINITY_DN1555_c0_g1_i1.p1 TRINITY_DN1555_c0_g1~~TRINITY_DN1555_c0_g1_i1.p1  ORF type:complete len:113 (-),score=27.68 TRINITY_DN1555_c0_g1_i1:92-430(-)